MLKALELENFKAFGKRTRIEFAPITLIFGENSAGKSSILQALNLLKQTRESREHGALLLPRTENGIVDLGSYQELLFDHDLNRDLSIRVDFEAQRDMVTDNNPNASQGMEFRFTRRDEKDEIHLDAISLINSDVGGQVAVFTPDLPTRKQASSVMREVIKKRARAMVYDEQFPPRRSKRTFARCCWVTENEDLWKRHFELAKDNSKRINRSLQVTKRRLESDDRFEVNDNDKDIKERLKELEAAIEFYRSDFQYEDFVNRMRNGELSAVVELDGFVPTKRVDDGLPELSTSQRVVIPRHERESTVNIARLAIRSGMRLDRVLESIYPMGPFRRPPERWYIFTGTSPQDVGYRGDLLPDLLFRSPDLVSEANEWLANLEIGYQIEVRDVGLRSSDLFEVRLIDTRRGKKIDVALTDVGFGISQILPFIVQSLAGEKQIITIEQPEVHIHPRLQADLGDLLASAIETRENRFVIETHSEHLVLRMQRLIREGKLDPKDLSVIYVSRHEEGSLAQRLHLDQDGDFIDEWPGGFFPERLKEI